MARRWYCGMCEELFPRSGDCPRCGFKLERWPEDETPHPDSAAHLAACADCRALRAEED